MAEEIKAQIAAILEDDDALTRYAEEGFAEVDADGSGSIDSAELGTALAAISAELGEAAPSQDDIDNAYAAIDVSNDGKIDVSEFKTLLQAILQGIHDAL